MNTTLSRLAVLLALCLVLAALARGPRTAAEAEAVPFGLSQRTEWTTSHVTGSPEPPPPYRTVQVFKKLKFNRPLLMASAPGTDRLFVGEQDATLYSFENRPDVEKADVFINLRSEVKTLAKTDKAGSVAEVYGLAFHPKFEKNRYCYICYTVNSVNWGESLPDGTRVSRFTVTDTNPPRCIPESEQIVITWPGGGHNGGCLAFGPDGCLYISSGDAGFPNPPDPRHTGQDISDLLSSVLRIDVDRAADGEKAYTIPADNPFVDLEGARGEVWAYGFRNPWKITFDRGTGDLWAGDVGWEMWEMLQRVERGGNYGWSIMEGQQSVYPDGQPGPTPISLPTIELPHTEAASVTGGYVYRGSKYPDLVGTYIYGDWETRHIWGSKVNGKEIGERKELVTVGPRIVAFGEDNAGELYVVGYDEGSIYQLVPNDQRERNNKFPRKLSETGLFANTAEHALAAGVVPFTINAPQWADHATAERMIALPPTTSVVMHQEPIEVPGSMFKESFSFPADGVLAKTIWLETKTGDPASRRRLETQLLHFDGRAWHGYSYQWNDEQTDATLVDAKGADRTFDIADPAAPGGQRKQTWHFASRTECLVCHNPWAGNRLAFNPLQLNRNNNYNGVVDNQLRALEHIGIVKQGPPPKLDANKLLDDEAVAQAAKAAAEATRSDRFAKQPKLTDPYSSAGDINDRARSYLHVNCSHCHQFGAGGSVDIELRQEFPIEQTKCLENRPTQGAFGIQEANILAPGDPYRSVLFYRMTKLGRGRMPHMGSEIVDDAGTKLMHDWIRQLPIRKDQFAALERLRSLDEAAALAGEAKQTKLRLKQIALDIARNEKRDVATDDDRAKARVQLDKEHANAAKSRMEGRDAAISQLLSTTSGALILAHALESKPLTPGLHQLVLERVAKSPDIQVQEAFERFVPASQRAERLGSVVNAAQLLAMPGDAARGKKVFFELANLQCKNCHQIQAQGAAVGPELSRVGVKLTKAQILENILEPSKVMEPKYVTYTLQTTSGQVVSGLLESKTLDEVVLKDAQGKQIKTPAADVEKLTPQRKSLMPEQLLRDLTAQQAADLLTYLESLK